MLGREKPFNLFVVFLEITICWGAICFVFYFFISSLFLTDVLNFVYVISEIIIHGSFVTHKIYFKT